MLDNNTNKVVWVSVAVGLVAVMASGAFTLFPSAMESVTTTVHHAAIQYVDPDTGFGENNPIVDDYHYGDDGTAWLMNYHHTNKNVVVPETLHYNGKDYTVTRINDGALQGRQLDSVSLPDTVVSIGTSALMTNDLTSITLPKNLKTIGNSAFAENKLTSVTFNGNLRSVGDYAFRDNSLKTVTMNNGLQTIGAGVFQNNNLTSVALPDSIQSIGNWAFSAGSDSSKTYVKTITKAPAIVAPGGANYNANAFAGDVSWPS